MSNSPNNNNNNAVWWKVVKNSKQSKFTIIIVGTHSSNNINNVVWGKSREKSQTDNFQKIIVIVFVWGKVVKCQTKKKFLIIQVKNHSVFRGKKKTM